MINTTHQEIMPHLTTPLIFKRNTAMMTSDTPWLTTSEIYSSSPGINHEYTRCHHCKTPFEYGQRTLFAGGDTTLPMCPECYQRWMILDNPERRKCCLPCFRSGPARIKYDIADMVQLSDARDYYYMICESKLPNIKFEISKFISDFCDDTIKQYAASSDHNSTYLLRFQHTSTILAFKRKALEMLEQPETFEKIRDIQAAKLRARYIPIEAAFVNSSLSAAEAIEQLQPHLMEYKIDDILATVEFKQIYDEIIQAAFMAGLRIVTLENLRHQVIMNYIDFFKSLETATNDKKLDQPSGTATQDDNAPQITLKRPSSATDESDASHDGEPDTPTSSSSYDSAMSKMIDNTIADFKDLLTSQ